MPKISNATKVTITIVVSLIMGYLGYRLLRDLPLFGSSRVLYTYYKKVNGLTSGSYIYINGVKVGSVKAIKLEGPDSVRVSLTLNKGIKITKGSVAKLESSGLLGDKAIYIDKGPSSQVVENGATIKGMYTQGMISELQEKGTKLTNDASESFSKLNETLTRLQKLVNKKNRQNINQTLADLKNSTHQLSLLMQRKRKDLESTIDHAQHMMANFDTLSTKNKPKLDSAFTHLNNAMNNLQEVSANFKTTSNKLNSLLSNLNHPRGTVGKLVTDPSLYNHLDSLSVSLDRLIKHINDDPGKFLKGVDLIDIF